MLNIEQIRADLALTSNLAYLDNAAASVPPKQVIAAINTYMNRTAETGPYLPAFRKETYAKVEQIRANTAALIGAHADEIAFTKNASEAISFVAKGIDWQSGDEIIVPDCEILSNLTPWVRLEITHGVKVVCLSTNAEGLITVDALSALITPKTRLFAFSHLPNATGALQPAQALCDLAKSRGIMSLVNAAQTIGLVPTNVKTLGCDFLATCGRKALRGPEGSGFLYVKKEHIQNMEPALTGWWNSSFDMETEAITLPQSAKRFEAGCPIVPAILGMGAAIEYAQNIGMTQIEKRVRDLTTLTVESLRSIDGVDIYGPSEHINRMLVVPFNRKGINPDALVKHLEDNGVIIEAGHFMALPVLRRHNIEKMIRISPLYFNTEEEIERTISLIRDFN